MQALENKVAIATGAASSIGQGIALAFARAASSEDNHHAIEQQGTSGLDVRDPGPEFTLIEADEVGEMAVEAVRRNVFLLPTHRAVIPSLFPERAIGMVF